MNRKIMSIIPIIGLTFSIGSNLTNNKKHTSKDADIYTNIKNTKSDTKKSIDLNTIYKGSNILHSDISIHGPKSKSSSSVTDLSDDEQFFFNSLLSFGVGIGLLVGFVFGIMLCSSNGLATEIADLANFKAINGKEIELQDAITASRDAIPFYNFHNKPILRASIIIPTTTIAGGAIGGSITAGLVYSGEVIYNTAN